MGQVEKTSRKFFEVYSVSGYRRMRITIRVELFKSYRNIKGKPSSGRLIKIGPSYSILTFVYFPVVLRFSTYDSINSRPISSKRMSYNNSY